MNSVTPFSASGERRMTSREAPRRPQGTKVSSPRIEPSGATAVTMRQRPSAGSPSRPSAIEKPRSVSLPRHASARRTTSSTSCGARSANRRTWAVYPARRTRVTAWRIGFMSRPESENESASRIASSPRARARSPCATYSVDPAAEAERTAG